ncbi:response regulator [Ottowia flava]
MAPCASAFSTARPRLMVVDDHELVRLGLAALMAAQATDGPTSDTLEACTLAEGLLVYAEHQHCITLVLLDLHLPDTHGLSGLREFMARFPAAPIAVLSGDSDPALRQQALQAGARAFLPKAGHLADVIAYLAAQGLVGPPAMPLAESPCASSPYGARDATRTIQTRDGERLRLTHRQAEMLDWVLAGQSNREIAGRAHLTEGTVKNHVSALLLIFGVRSRAQLISRLR